MSPIFSGAELIAMERKRQVEAEGFTSEHDDKHEMLHINGEYYSPLRAAARCYMSNRASTTYRSRAPDLWPFELRWWKPASEVGNLVKAGALIAAEIDRLQRKDFSSYLAVRGERLDGLFESFAGLLNRPE